MNDCHTLNDQESSQLPQPAWVDCGALFHVRSYYLPWSLHSTAWNKYIQIQILYLGCPGNRHHMMQDTALDSSCDELNLCRCLALPIYLPWDKSSNFDFTGPFRTTILFQSLPVNHVVFNYRGKLHLNDA